MQLTRAQLAKAREWLAAAFVLSPVTEGYRLATLPVASLPRTSEAVYSERPALRPREQDED